MTAGKSTVFTITTRQFPGSFLAFAPEPLRKRGNMETLFRISGRNFIERIVLGIAACQYRGALWETVYKEEEKDLVFCAYGTIFAIGCCT